MDYKKAGVDISKADLFVERIGKLVKSTYNASVVAGVGGFSALYDIGDGRYLASGTDGVGTKLKMAQQLGIHHTIGIDLVAMSVNDVLCTGARPLFFLDYLAVGSLNLEREEKILQGIVKGCELAQVALIGGETAEMPGMYQSDEYDLAGFCVGEVSKERLIDGSKIEEGDSLIGLSSSGFHSNGYSLLRKMVQPDEMDLLEELLTPTTIYVPLIKDLLRSYPGYIKGLAHITGGGFDNIKRMNPHFKYEVTSPPPLTETAPVFHKIVPRMKISTEELYKTFNMGVGFVLATDHPQDILKWFQLHDQKAWKIGKIGR